MAGESHNPRITAVLLGVTWLEVAVLLVAGGGLLVAHASVVAVWPWALAPFNLRFLGALYSAALVAALLQCLYARWSPARTVTTMIFVFTLVVTILSFVHFARFDLRTVPAWIWFVLYVGVCVNAGAHLAFYRNPSLAGHAPGPAASALLLVQATALGGYGLALLAAPEAAARLWPWKLDTFHAQIYSVTFLTPAAGALTLRRRASRADWLTLGLTQVAWGLLPIVALLVVDAKVHRVDWGAVATWAWIALFAAIAATGAWMLGQAWRDAAETT